MAETDSILEIIGSRQPPKSLATGRREDLSRFIIHLTRDDRGTFPNGKAARDNFQDILKTRQILSVRPHCYFMDALKKCPKSFRAKFDVACLSEVPLNQLQHVVGNIPGRRIKLEAYGLVFTKEFIIASGGQPAIYINSYNGNGWLRESAFAWFEAALKDKDPKLKLWRMLPFINAMNERHDFSWEREWRVQGNLVFTRADVVCVILPAEGEGELKKRFAQRGIAVISPGWTYDQIVVELARQQRSTKDFADIVGKPTATSAKKGEPSNTSS